MTQRHCRICKGWHDMGEPWPMECAGHYGQRGQRSDVIPTPMIALDTIDPLQHPADGRYYTSKSEIRRVAKAHNLIEVGTERQTDNRKNDAVTRDEVGAAIQKLNSGYRPNVQSEPLS